MQDNVNNVGQQSLTYSKWSNTGYFIIWEPYFSKPDSYFLHFVCQGQSLPFVSTSSQLSAYRQKSRVWILFCQLVAIIIYKSTLSNNIQSTWRANISILFAYRKTCLSLWEKPKALGSVSFINEEGRSQNNHPCATWIIISLFQPNLKCLLLSIL